MMFEIKEIDVSGQDDIPEVEPAEAYRVANEADGVILDVREHDEVEQVSIVGAMHIPLGELHRRVGEVPRDCDVYLLCHVGQRSAMATSFLMQSGRERVWNIRGGIIGWVKSGLPADWHSGS